MAESETLLQLGIEAAREGNREEARNLFSLLTRQEPDNVQGWLWYAGVAEGQDERRAALERVVELDPSNEMARRGLQAMGVTPTTRPATAPLPATEVADTIDAPTMAPVAPATAPARSLTEDEQLAAELDAAYDDYDTVEREGPAFRNEPTRLRDEDDLESTAVGAGAAERVRARRNNRQYEEEAAPARRPNGLLLLLAALILIVLLAFWLGPRLLNRGGQTVAGTGTVFPTSDAGLAGTGAISGTNGITNTGAISGTDGVTNTGAISGTNGVTSTGAISGTDTVSSTVPISNTDGVTGSAIITSTVPVTGTDGTGAPAAPTAEAAAPTPVPAAPPSGDLAAANPQVVPTGQNIDAGGWSFTFPGFCSGSCAVELGKQIGNNTAQGQYVMTLVLVSNNTGTEQATPQNFFVIKDGQGNVYTPLPQVSSAYVSRGVNADRSEEDTIPPGTANTSIPLVFDIPSGATNLVLFSSANTGQGFQVLNAVQ